MTARGAKSNPILAPKDATVPFNKERLSPWSGRSLDQIQSDAYPEIKTLKLATTSPADAYKKAEAAMKAKGWTVVTQDPAKLRLEASVESFWFGFKDDVILVVTSDGAGSAVDMRSVSRVGVSDLGANAKRIEALLTALKS